MCDVFTLRERCDGGGVDGRSQGWIRQHEAGLPAQSDIQLYS